MRIPVVAFFVAACNGIALSPPADAQATTGTVVEYVNVADFPNSIGGQYFYSSDPVEQAAVDAGTAGRFRRTGFTFNAGGDTDLCRFYGSVTPGPNSHFFTANATECAQLRVAQVTPRPTSVKQWNYEGNGFKVIAVQNGVCPDDTLPVYRAYNNGFARGFDSNHRYTTSANSLKAVVDQGWTSEGVVFCTLQAPGVAPLIGEALTCGTSGPAGGLGGRNQPLGLQRQLIDVAAFPEARCNDGSAAVFYFRPFAGAANRDKWLVQLQGGGDCSSADDCAARYCSIDTNFGIQGMSSFPAPGNGINGLGITARSNEVSFPGSNPWESYNHVFVKYCSSDRWVGTASDVPVSGLHPVTRAPLTYRINFLGSRIIDAVLTQLRQAGGAPAVYTLGAAPVTMPDLDAAEEVVVAGGSAGGIGTIHNLDRVAGILKANSSRCSGGACPVVRGLADSALLPAQSQLDYQYSTFCTNHGLCNAEITQRSLETNGLGRLWKPKWDQSCIDINTPLGSTWKCLDSTNVLFNHVTTPLFVRMGLIDESIGPQYVDAKLAVAGKGPMTMTDFALLAKTNLIALANVRTTAIEKASISTTPGAFGPLCPDHETLRGPETFTAGIQSGGQLNRMFMLYSNWVAGAALINLSSSGTGDTSC
jgi:hypothetical protein